jgi:hypothetical protein
MSKMPLAVIYNDDFDEQHYPILDWQIGVLAQIEKHYNLPETASWIYDRTIHGAIFALKDGIYSDRIPHDTCVFLNSLKGFRWIESTDKRLAFGLSGLDDPK